MSKHFLMVTSAVLEWSKVTEHKSDGKCTLGNSWKYIVNNVYCACIMSIYFIKTCRFQLWDKYVNGLTQLKDVGQLWFWSSRAVVWVQTDQCEGGFAAVRLLHLIPGLHYTTGPVKQHTDMGTSLPSKDVEEYCIASCTTEVISLLQPNAAKSNLNIVLSVRTSSLSAETNLSRKHFSSSGTGLLLHQNVSHSAA